MSLLSTILSSLEADARSTNELDCKQQQVVSHLYKKMAKAAAAKTLSIVRRKDLASEIVQEVFLKLWQKKMVFPNEKAAYVWIYKACHNAGIDYLRSGGFRYEDPRDDYVELGGEARVHFADQLLAREIVLKAASKLSPREADILVYSAVDHMTNTEIADILGVSTKTIQRDLIKIAETLGKMAL